MKDRLITDSYDGYELRYPFLVEHVKTQLEEQFWTATEVRVDLDQVEMLYALTDEQRNVVKRLLPLFLRYELYVGSFWTDTYAKLFPCPEAQEAAVTVAMVERAVHARFYDKINKAFGLDKDVHYLSYLDDPAFKDRAKWIGDLLKSDDKVLVCLAFGLIESSALFSAFALLRSFQTGGLNLIGATVKGTKQSAIDERLHSLILADTLRVMFAELGTTIDESEYKPLLDAHAKIMYLNEEHIIDSMIGDVFNGHKKSEYKKFVRCCINDYFTRLGSKDIPFPDAKDSEMYEWFALQNEAYSDPDFFTRGIGKEYESGWNEDDFGGVW